MVQTEADNLAVRPSLGRFEVVFKQLERRIEGSAKKIEASLVRMTSTLETHFGRLEAKLNIAGDELAALAAQSKETGNSLGRFVEAIGKYSGVGPIEGAGALISLVPGDSDDQKAFSGFYKQAPNQLLERFETLERDIAALGTDPDKIRAEKAIDKMRHEQKLILTALINQGGVFRTKLEDLARLNPNLDESEKSRAFLDNKESLKTIREVLDTIREFATSPELQKLIDDSRVILERKPQQTGALATSPQDHQLVSAGGSTIYPGSDTAGRSLQRHVESLGETAQAYNRLNEERERFTAQGGSLIELVEATNGGFGRQSALLGILRKQAPELAEAMAGFFDETTEGAEGLNRAVAAMGERFLGAFEGAILRGESLGDTLKSLARDLAGLALNEVKTNGISGLFGKLGNLFGGGASTAAAPAAASSATSLIWIAKGNAFSNGRLTALAKGGALTNSIVNRPTLFPMADGAGLMGESGPEAVLPLTRLANGELGVKSLPGAGAGTGARSGPVTITINAPGADRETLQRVVAEVRGLRADLVRVNNSIEPRAINAVSYRRSRGPW